MPFINLQDKRFKEVTLLPDRGFDDRDATDMQSIQNTLREELVNGAVGDGVVTGLEVIKGGAGWALILNAGSAFVGGELIVVPLIDTTLQLGDNSFTEDEVWYVLLRPDVSAFTPTAPGQPGFYADSGQITSYRQELGYTTEIVDSIPTYTETEPYIVLAKIERSSTATDINDVGVVVTDRREFLRNLKELTEIVDVMKADLNLQKRLMLLQAENYDNVVFDDFVDESQAVEGTTAYYNEKLQEYTLNSSAGLYTTIEEILLTVFFTPQLPVAEEFYLPDQMDDTGDAYSYIQEIEGQTILVTNYPVLDPTTFEVRNSVGELVDVGDVTAYEFDASRKSVVIGDTSNISAGNYVVSHMKIAPLEAVKPILTEDLPDGTVIKKEFSFDGITFFPFSMIGETRVDGAEYDSYDKTRIMFRFSLSTTDQLVTPTLRDWAVLLRMQDLPTE